MKRILCVMLLSFFMSVSAYAASMTGEWQGNLKYISVSGVQGEIDLTFYLSQFNKRIRGTFEFSECFKKGRVRGIVNGNTANLLLKKDNDRLCENNIDIRIKTTLSEDGNSMDFEVVKGYMYPDGGGSNVDKEFFYRIVGSGTVNKVE